jgi:hypothetical protein
MLLTASFIACAPAGFPTQSLSTTPTPTSFGGVAIRLREGQSAPPGCAPADVAQWIASALDALSSGNQDRLAGAFRDNPVFSVSTEPGGTFFVLSGGQQELLAYFAERHRHGEVARLQQLDVGYSGGRAQFGFLLSREADDVKGVAPGKGELDCETHRIEVWNVGRAVP